MLDERQLVAIIEAEIEEREQDQDGLHLGEIGGLWALKSKIEAKEPLTFAQYSWLCDLVDCYAYIRGEESAVEK